MASPASPDRPPRPTPGDGAWTVTCDPGIDDAVALALVAGRSDLAVDAVVAGAGNAPLPAAHRNAAGMAALVGLAVPVGRGSSRSLSGAPLARRPSPHGSDGLGGLADRLPGGARRQTPARVGAWQHVLATGPLTDVARARRRGHLVRGVVWMGGSVTGLGSSIDPLGGEFNAGADPQAADEVLGSGAAVRVVPVEVTAQVVLGAEHVAPWRSGPPGARLCAELVDRHRRGRWPVPLHDPVAVVAAVEPDLFRWRHGPLRCRPGGTLSDPGPDRGRPPASVAVGIDVPAVRRLVVDGVLGAPSPAG